MKKSKPCLPRKMKKAMKMLELKSDAGDIGLTFHARMYCYPRTRWIVRAERKFRRKFRELQQKKAEFERLKAIMNEVPY